MEKENLKGITDSGVPDHPFHVEQQISKVEQVQDPCCLVRSMEGIRLKDLRERGEGYKHMGGHLGV